eukprot:680900-Hanusia_phi.AAC.2
MVDVCLPQALLLDETRQVVKLKVLRKEEEGTEVSPTMAVREPSEAQTSSGMEVFLYRKTKTVNLESAGDFIRHLRDARGRSDLISLLTSTSKMMMFSEKWNVDQLACNAFQKRLKTIQTLAMKNASSSELERDSSELVSELSQGISEELGDELKLLAFQTLISKALVSMNQEPRTENEAFHRRCWEDIKLCTDDFWNATSARRREVLDIISLAFCHGSFQYRIGNKEWKYITRDFQLSEGDVEWLTKKILAATDHVQLSELTCTCLLSTTFSVCKETMDVRFDAEKACKIIQRLTAVGARSKQAVIDVVNILSKTIFRENPSGKSSRVLRQVLELVGKEEATFTTTALTCFNRALSEYLREVPVSSFHFDMSDLMGVLVKLPELLSSPRDRQFFASLMEAAFLCVMKHSMQQHVAENVFKEAEQENALSPAILKWFFLLKQGDQHSLPAVMSAHKQVCGQQKSSETFDATIMFLTSVKAFEEMFQVLDEANQRGLLLSNTSYLAVLMHARSTEEALAVMDSIPNRALQEGSVLSAYHDAVRRNVKAKQGLWEKQEELERAGEEIRLSHGRKVAICDMIRQMTRQKLFERFTAKPSVVTWNSGRLREAIAAAPHLRQAVREEIEAAEWPERGWQEQGEKNQGEGLAAAEREEEEEREALSLQCEDESSNDVRRTLEAEGEESESSTVAAEEEE